MSEHEITNADRTTEPAGLDADGQGGAQPTVGRPDSTLSRRSVLRIGFAAAGAAAVGPRLAGQAAAQATPSGGASADGVLRSSVPGVPDALTRLPAPYRTVARPPASGGEVTTHQIVFQPPIPGRDENRWWQELEKRLGVSRLDASLVPGDSYNERLSAVVAGGEIPDLTVIFEYEAAQARLIQEGAFTDLTPYLTGDALQEFPNLAGLPAYLWENVKIEGKIYGVPRDTAQVSAPLMWRQDWAEKLGVAEIGNAEDFRRVVTAFAGQDPDGDGSADSWGLAGQSTWSGGIFSRAFFEYMFRSPYNWRLDADGTLTHRIETEELRQATAFMRELYAAGIYHPDTVSLANGKAQLIAGEIGGYIDGWGALPGTAGLRGQARVVDPNANVIGLVPPGHDGGRGVTHNSIGFWGQVAIPSSVDDEERVRELLRILDFYAAPVGSEEWLFLNYGAEGVHWRYDPDGQPVKTEQGKREVGGHLEYLAMPSVALFFDRPGDAAYMQKLAEQYVSIGIEDPVMGIFSATQAERGGELDQIEKDATIAVVTGREPLDALERLAEEWRSRGGDAIRAELQEKLAASA
jgi:putative aldouronate transport system substrate-binding protein